jgi:surfactin synthase thioesterase subunit
LNEQIKNGLIKYPSGLKPKMNLMCFPFAGGGTINYARWRADLHDEINLFTLNLPGRERFFGQPCFTDYRDMILSLAELLATGSDIPMVFFGHSFGALTAYFTALEFNRMNKKAPFHVFISARVPPSMEHSVKMANLNPDEFKSILVEKYRGIPQEILSSPDLLNLFIPIIQQDFKMYEQYPEIFASYENQQMDCDITTIGFTDDYIGQEQLQEWRQYTKKTHQHFQFAGGHFEILTSWKAVVTLINQLIIPT